ncbi:MAG: hypothetical protein PHD76_07320 [Methylacidiphilales bacterium]|nr:hypothetical protein [Candidatus Methylacidiphilales bacterium]
MIGLLQNGETVDSDCSPQCFPDITKAQVYDGIIIPIRRKSRAVERAALVQLLDRAVENGISGNINFA